jgi:hypothetical protein
MYISDPRHIHDPVLSSLKMEGVRLLFIIIIIIIIVIITNICQKKHFSEPGVKDKIALK